MYAIETKENDKIEQEKHPGMIIFKISKDISNLELNMIYDFKIDVVEETITHLKMELIREAIKYGDHIRISESIFIDTRKPIDEHDVKYYYMYNYLDIYNSIKTMDCSRIYVSVRVHDSSI